MGGEEEEDKGEGRRKRRGGRKGRGGERGRGRGGKEGSFFM